MAALVIVSPAALADIEAILDYLIARGGAAVADSYESDFTTLFSRIAVHPGIGAPRANLGRDVRLMTVKPYSIYYDGAPKADRAVILRVVRGPRRMTRQLLAEGRK